MGKAILTSTIYQFTERLETGSIRGFSISLYERKQGTFYLLPGKEHVVGRKNCDILLANDQSISRLHATLTVTEQTVTLKDSSKYGTFVNGEQLPAGSTKTLHTGDRLTFGVFQSKFRLELNVVVCSSCVDNEGKVTLSQAVQSVGGRLVNSWSQDCTHLVMPTVKVTIKTICALLCCRPIVKPEFFTELWQAVQRKETLPKSENFRPEIDEPSLTNQEVDLDPRPERKSLFKDKTFVFFNSKQARLMKRLSQAISCGGGKIQLLEEGSLPVSLLESTGTCVIDVATGSSQALISPTTKKWIDSVGQVLHRNGLRFITESEIGLAAIYVSNQTYCNPCSSMDSESVRVKSAIHAATLSQNATVDETVLPAASQNITAYVANTETSQSFSRTPTGPPQCRYQYCKDTDVVVVVIRIDGCGATAVGETPEKRPVQANPLGSTRPASTSARRQPTTACSVSEPGKSAAPPVRDRTVANPPGSTRAASTSARRQPSTACSFSEPGKSSLTTTERVQKQKKVESTPTDIRNDDAISPAPVHSSASLKKSPQKQSALTSFFQPVSKKRQVGAQTTHTLLLLREGSADSSEAKLSRRECEDEENAPRNTDQAASVPSWHTGQKQHGTTAQSNFSQSLGLGSVLAMSSGSSWDRPSKNCDSGLASTSKKRKEPVQDQPPEPEMPEERADLDVSLEELESIMSEDMEDPEESAASKKQRLDQGESSTASKRRNPKYHNTASSNQQRVEAPQSRPNKNQNFKQDMSSRASNPQSSERSPQATDLQQDRCSSVPRKGRSESPDIKDEEVSFVVASKAENGSNKPREVTGVKQEPKSSTEPRFCCFQDASSAPTSENDSELPRKLLHVQFKSLVVTAPSRIRSDPLKSRNPNGKNFKRFCKVPVPGLEGLPNIIGGSDLVAHNRSKNSELEEWLRGAAEEEKRQAREDTLGDDLFRYNPKPSKRR
ncbi:hypothetical protein NFI96_016966 [Prochilodus magdalenae]|nr:hypothetical protein NFI96_016966 [Prochilodus magdalenae]